MASLNKVLLIGNLTRDPEIRYTPGGQMIGSMSLAINRKYKTQTGEVREEVTFVETECWGKSAELAQQYCRKGSPLFVEGRLKLDQWDDKTTGQKRQKLKVLIDRIQFLPQSQQPGQPAQATATAAPGSAAQSQAHQRQPPDPSPVAEYDESPF